MAICKGNLVSPKDRMFGTLTQKYDSTLWTEPGIVVKGPYERVERPNNLTTYVAICIDVLVKGTLVEGLYVHDFKRVVIKSLRD